MRVTDTTIDAQNDFRDCYRNRLSAVYHLSYLRLCKSKLIYHLLRSYGVELSGVRLFDYAFGAGTFLLKLPKDCKISGVELDAQVVAGTASRLKAAGYQEVDLDVIEIESWSKHRLIGGTYDVIVCSHILEHLDDPCEFLSILKGALSETGAIVALVPINEVVPDPHHVQTCDQATISSWASNSGLTLKEYIETDHWNYWAKKYLPYEQRPLLRKGWSLLIGGLASLAPNSLWWRGSGIVGKLFRAQPTQAGFILSLG